MMAATVAPKQTPLGSTACFGRTYGSAIYSRQLDESEVEFSHHMQVTRIDESPRVTKPYTEEQWADVMALGAEVDKELVAGDVRLTMGGEPTFLGVNGYYAGRRQNLMTLDINLVS